MEVLVLEKTSYVTLVYVAIEVAKAEKMVEKIAEDCYDESNNKEENKTPYFA